MDLIEVSGIWICLGGFLACRFVSESFLYLNLLGDIFGLEISVKGFLMCGFDRVFFWHVGVKVANHFRNWECVNREGMMLHFFRGS